MERVVGVYDKSNEDVPGYIDYVTRDLPPAIDHEDVFRNATCICVAEKFDLEKIRDIWLKLGATKVILYLEAVYVSGVSIQMKESMNMRNEALIFFEYGVAVLWGCAAAAEDAVIEIVSETMDEPLPFDERERDVFKYKYNTNEKSHIQNDTITIHRANNTNEKIKMAISHALAQTTKLTIFEDRVQKIIAHTMHLPQVLARHGYVKVSRKDVAKLCGQVFLQKTAVNLLASVLDTPEYFWNQQDSLQALYEKVGEYCEISSRTEVINSRFDLLHNMLELIRDHQNTTHSSRLEWIIIYLIVIEVIIGIITILMAFYSHQHF